MLTIISEVQNGLNYKMKDHLRLFYTSFLINCWNNLSSTISDFHYQCMQLSSGFHLGPFHTSGHFWIKWVKGQSATAHRNRKTFWGQAGSGHRMLLSERWEANVHVTTMTPKQDAGLTTSSDCLTLKPLLSRGCDWKHRSSKFPEKLHVSEQESSDHVTLRRKRFPCGRGSGDSWMIQEVDLVTWFYAKLTWSQSRNTGYFLSFILRTSSHQTLA